MSTQYKKVVNLKVAKPLYDLVKDEIAPGTGISSRKFWQSLGQVVDELGPKNQELLNKRDNLQSKIDAWHIKRKGHPIDKGEYKAFLEEIGYLVPEGEAFKVNVDNVDEEISTIAGPQLVVPVNIARYALNAANARWGSLYDALYGSDVISEDNGAEKGNKYNLVRGARVIEHVNNFLDETVPFKAGSYGSVSRFDVREESGKAKLYITFEGGIESTLKDNSQFVGYNLDDSGELSSILLKNNNLHIDIQIDKNDYVGKNNAGYVKDIILESAVTTIQDFEDAIAAVDADDKVIAYRNWNELMKGTLKESFEKSGKIIDRELNPDRTYTSPDGNELTLSGRSLMLVRNVGIHMYTDAVTTLDGKPIPEGFLDVYVTSLAAKHDLLGNGQYKNSKAGNINIVKPKQHGPEEVAATVELFGYAEDGLGLERNTIKIGSMDEERRTTVNLKECIREAKERVIFINTGFLDRTGDEIHTSMEAGPMIPKGEMKSHKWLKAYEDWNVDIGIECGLPGYAQIGKGMWAMPDEMKSMMESKIEHPMAGASTAWVPSPTAATLHSIHYHQVNVSERQSELASRERASLDDILTIPLLDRELSREEIINELRNNVQGILGYEVRWVGQGIGCSKVPDIHDINQMLDRATLRIDSQHIANWLYHGITNRDQVLDIFNEMAVKVDEQNSNDPNYTKMSVNFDESIEFQAGLDLVFNGLEEPNGYTENVLHTRRKEVKFKQKN